MIAIAVLPFRLMAQEVINEEEWVNVTALSHEDTISATTTETPIAEQWRPDPMRAVWMGTIIPGYGQIYNRAYWKLPIVYGAFMGCAYAISWNNRMYQDYKQAYRDILTDTDGTKTSYFLVTLSKDLI